MLRRCPNCGKEIVDDEIRFCPECGTDMMPESWICNVCGAENRADAKFCSACGANRDERTLDEDNSFWQKLQQGRYTRYIIVLILVMVVAAGGSYYFFNNMSESHYLTYYAEASRTLEQAETVLSNNVKADSLNKTDDTSDVQDAIKEQKDALDSEAKKFSSQKAFKGYTQQHQMTMELLQKESSVLERVNLILNNPLDEGTKDNIDSIKTDIQSIKSMENQIQVENTNMATGVDISNVPQQLQSFVSAQRDKDYQKQAMAREKKARQQDLAEFFQEMDKEIADYDNAKTDLGSMMESSRNGSMLWYDYFDVIDDAKTKRQDIKFSVGLISAPSGTESLQQQFSQVLSESIRYCDLMRMSANLEYWEHYQEGNVKYEEAKKLNKQVQDDYQAFMSSYNSQKKQMTGK